MRVCIIVVALLLCLVTVRGDHPFFKVFSQETPIYRGRADPIVAPGQISQHSHKVFGASGFSYGTGRTNEQIYDDLRASTCTTITVTEDKSNYWIPDLYYQWPNGSLSLVPNGGLTVYYIGRDGSQQPNPDYQAFPRGFRMIAGNPFRRNFTGTIADQATTWACLAEPGMPETNNFSTTTRPCVNGLRAQVFFPQCWDGVRIDSPNHMDHVAYPIERYNTGNCPSTHPKRLMSVFFEILFSVTKFPHGNGIPNRFVLAPGDTTGYGLHGDFLSGWNITLLQNVFKDPSCLSVNTNNGNQPEKCDALKPYVKTSNPDSSCVLDKPIPNYEDIGLNHWIGHLPGNNPISSGPGQVTPKFGTYAQTISPDVYRVLLKSTKNGLYVSSLRANDPLTASVPQSQLSYPQVFDMVAVADGKYAIATESTGRWVSSNNGGSPLTGDRYDPSGWELWYANFTGGTKPTQAGTTGFLLGSNGRYVTVQANGQLIASSATVGTNEQFVFIDANAGISDTRS